MAKGPDDDTIRLKRGAQATDPVRPANAMPRRPAPSRGTVVAAAVTAFVVLAAIGGWMAWRRPPPAPATASVLATPAAAPAPSVVAAAGPAPVLAAVPPQAPPQAPPAASLPLASEAEILADQPQQLTLFRFAANPHILVFDFPGLREQGLMLDRVAAFAEKQGVAHDRVLTDSELARAIAAHGDTVETYYYGHDYSAATLAGFFSLADRDHIPLNAQEERLRGLLGGQGLLAADAVGAVITLPRLGADALVDLSFRRTILHHELSHGEYFTDPAYVAYVYHFWNDVMDEPARAAFRKFLVEQDYDPALTDLTINETQAYLMHTPDKRAFSAEALGLAPVTLGKLQAAFLLGMPPGWLRDCTSAPPAETEAATVAAVARAPAAPAATTPTTQRSPRLRPNGPPPARQRSAVSTTMARPTTRPPRRTALARAD